MQKEKAMFSDISDFFKKITFKDFQVSGSYVIEQDKFLTSLKY